MVSNIVGAVGSIIGGNAQANASKDAASVQSAAANQAASMTQQQYQQNRQDMMPWLTAGTGSINKLSDLLGTSSNTTSQDFGSLLKPFGASDFQEDPGYQFTLSEGQKAIDRAQSSRGNVLSGAAYKAANNYAQNTASSQYGAAFDRFNTKQNNIYNRLAGVSNTGQATGTGLGTAGANATNSANNELTSGAAANATGIVGRANAWNSGLTNAVSDLASSDYLKSTLGKFF